MSTEELTVILFALTFTAIGAALGALVCALLALRRINRLQKDVSTAFNSLAQKQNSSRKELNELLTGNIGIIKKFQDFQESVERLSDKQADLELKEPEGRMYSRAKKMIQLGAGLEEVVRECEIPLPEAELPSPLPMNSYWRILQIGRLYNFRICLLLTGRERHPENWPISIGKSN